jgi:hypothetical protein
LLDSAAGFFNLADALLDYRPANCGLEPLLFRAVLGKEWDLWCSGPNHFFMTEQHRNNILDCRERAIFPLLLVDITVFDGEIPHDAQPKTQPRLEETPRATPATKS